MHQTGSDNPFYDCETDYGRQSSTKKYKTFGESMHNFKSGKITPKKRLLPARHTSSIGSLMEWSDRGQGNMVAKEPMGDSTGETTMQGIVGKGSFFFGH